MSEEAEQAKRLGPGPGPGQEESQGPGLAAGLMPHHGRRAVIVMLLMSLGAVGLVLLFLATHPRRAPLHS